MCFTLPVSITPLCNGLRHGVTRHHQGHTTKTVTFFNPIAVFNRTRLNLGIIATRVPNDTSNSMGHNLNNIAMPLNAVSARKALAVMNSHLTNRKGLGITLSSTVIVRMCKSSTIAQRAGTGSGFPSNANPSNSDAPFGDPYRQ